MLKHKGVSYGDVFCIHTPFGLVQALHLSELIAAFYREMVHTSAGQHPPEGVTLWGMAALQSPQWPPVASSPVTRL